MNAVEEKRIITEKENEYEKIAKEFDLDSGEIKVLVRYRKGAFVVFIDDKTELDWATSDEYDAYILEKQTDKKRAEIISEVEFIQHKPIINLLSEDLKENLIWMLAETFVYILDEEYDVAKGHICKINTFLEDRNYELSRKWHISYSSVITFGAFIVFYTIYFILKGKIEKNILEFIKFIPFGALGATISIFLGAKKKEYNCESGKVLNILEIMVRLITGMTASYLAICLYNLEMVFTIFKGSEHINEVLSVASFIVGFSERFIPSIVNKFESTDFKGE